MENLEPLHSENRAVILEILDGLRERAQNDEVLQLLIIVEDGGGFSANWTGTEDRFAISGFALGAILSRMGFTRTPEFSA